MEKCFYIFKFIVAFEPFIGKRFKKKKEMGRLSRLEDENCFIKNRIHRSKKKKTAQGFLVNDIFIQ